MKDALHAHDSPPQALASKLDQFALWLGTQHDCHGLRTEITVLRWLELLPLDAQVTVHSLGSDLRLIYTAPTSRGELMLRSLPYALQFALMRFCAESEAQESILRARTLKPFELHQSNLHT